MLYTLLATALLNQSQCWQKLNILTQLENQLGMRLFITMDTGGVTMEAVHLKMVERLLSGDTVRIVANGWVYMLC